MAKKNKSSNGKKLRFILIFFLGVMVSIYYVPIAIAENGNGGDTGEGSTGAGGSASANAATGPDGYGGCGNAENGPPGQGNPENGGGDGGGSGDNAPSCAGNQGQSCGNCGTIDCSGSCTSQGVCSPGSTQCSNNKYQTCSGSCGWTNSGTDADNDGTDSQCGDSLCDNSPGVYDSTKAQTETSCTDSLDNDCNGLADCQDTECAGSISGNVKNTDNENVADATLDMLQDTSSKYEAFTNTLGNYQANDVLCGNYNMVASASGYVSSAQTNINIPPQTPLTVNFDGNNALVSGSICEDDCTYTGDNTIHQECSGINGCAFYDAQAASACNLAQPGWIRDYNATQKIQCAEGIPYEQAEIKATVTCAKENLIKTTSIVNYLGKLVKMIVVTCG